jgi:hypothetical protein
VEFLGSGLDAFPGFIALGVGYTLYLVETRYCVPNVRGIVNGLLLFLREGKIFIRDMFAGCLFDFGHISCGAIRLPKTG